MLEIAKAIKAENEKAKGPATVLGSQTKLQDLKKMGLIMKAKNGRR